MTLLDRLLLHSTRSPKCYNWAHKQCLVNFDDPIEWLDSYPLSSGHLASTRPINMHNEYTTVMESLGLFLLVKNSQGFPVSLIFDLNKFFLRESVSRGRGRERISSKLHAQLGAWCRARSHDHETMTWAKIKGQKLNWLSHPGTPEHHIS